MGVCFRNSFTSIIVSHLHKEKTRWLSCSIYSHDQIYRWLLRVKDPDLTSGTTSAQSERRKKNLENVEKLRQRASEIEKIGENVVWVDPDEFPDFADQFMMYNSKAPTGFFNRGHDAQESSKAEGPKKGDFTSLRFLVGDSGIAALYNVKDEKIQWFRVDAYFEAIESSP